MSEERRQHYRRPFRSTALVVQQKGTPELCVRDLSLEGCGGYFNGDPRLEEGSVVRMKLPSLDIEVWAMMTRLIPVDKGRYYAGFHFSPSTIRTEASRLF